MIMVDHSQTSYDDGDDDDDGDIYIMMQCLFVCVSRKIITFPFRAERRRREVRHPAPFS